MVLVVTIISHSTVISHSNMAIHKQIAEYPGWEHYCGIMTNHSIAIVSVYDALGTAVIRKIYINKVIEYDDAFNVIGKRHVTATKFPANVQLQPMDER